MTTHVPPAPVRRLSFGFLMNQTLGMQLILLRQGLITLKGPVQLIIATWMLYTYLGPAGLCGLAIMVVSTPLNTLLSKKVSTYTKMTMAARDKPCVKPLDGK